MDGVRTRIDIAAGRNRSDQVGANNTAPRRREGQGLLRNHIRDATGTATATASALYFFSTVFFPPQCLFRRVFPNLNLPTGNLT